MKICYLEAIFIFNCDGHLGSSLKERGSRKLILGQKDLRDVPQWYIIEPCNRVNSEMKLQDVLDANTSWT